MEAVELHQQITKEFSNEKKIVALSVLNKVIDKCPAYCAYYCEPMIMLMIVR